VSDSGGVLKKLVSQSKAVAPRAARCLCPGLGPSWLRYASIRPITFVLSCARKHGYIAPYRIHCQAGISVQKFSYSVCQL